MNYKHILAAAGLLLCSQVTSADSIEVQLASKKPSAGGERCAVTFQITNRSFGTLHYANIPLVAADTSGKPIKFYGYSEIDNKAGQDFLALPKGDVMQTGIRYLEASCDSIGQISIDTNKVSEASCNIRNMPEDASCKQLLTVNAAPTQQSAQPKAKVAAKANKIGEGCHETAIAMIKAGVKAGWIKPEEANRSQIKDCSNDSLVMFKNEKSLYLQDYGKTLGYSEGRYQMFPQICWDLQLGKIYRNRGGSAGCRP